MKNRMLNILENTNSITYWDKSLNRFVDSKIDDSCIPYVALEQLENAYNMLEEELKLSVPKVFISKDNSDVKIIYPISETLKSYLKASIAGEQLMLEQDEERKVVHQYLISAYQTMLQMIEDQEQALQNI